MATEALDARMQTATGTARVEVGYSDVAPLLQIVYNGQH